ncbi:hypothetical protein [Vibrio sp. 10N.222.55.A1]|uniref:hypothetical protein n=1 Tax=Vibrio sp. 10N.222.55.A1 TaxID=3229646 RepID=UPI0035541FAA
MFNKKTMTVSGFESSSNYGDINQIIPLSPVAKAIRQELNSIIKPEHKGTYLSEQILLSKKLDCFYEEMGDREPTPTERKAIRQTLHRVYSGMLNGYDANDDKERHSTLKGLLKNLLLTFYQCPSHSHIRLGAILNCLQKYLDLAAPLVRDKYQALMGKSINTLKDLASDFVPSSAKQRGRNSRKDHELITAFLQTHEI